MIVLGHAISTMTDSNKGSLTNRAQCAKEHFKNDVTLGVKIGGTAGLAAAGIYAAKKSPKTLTAIKDVLVPIGKVIGKIAAKLGFKNFANVSSNKLKAAKSGAIGIGITGGLYLLNAIVTHANKRGKIDQKYEDAAKIESQTKNIVLEDAVKAYCEKAKAVDTEA